MTTNFSQYTKFAKNLALSAGKIAHKHFKDSSFKTSIKKDNSILTTADLEIEKMLRRKIAKQFPTHSIHGEEQENVTNKSEFTWYLDPIDGTTNFSLGIPVFCNMVALAKSSQVISSAIYQPITKKLYWAEKDKGCYLNNKKISVNQTASLEQTTLFVDRARGWKLNKFIYTFLLNNSLKFRSVKKLQCIGVSSCILAEGGISAYIANASNLYDLVPPSLIVSEAGGIVLNKSLEPWSLANHDWFISTPPHLINELKRLMKKS